jgi:hypothetical protein
VAGLELAKDANAAGSSAILLSYDCSAASALSAMMEMAQAQKQDRTEGGLRKQVIGYIC